MASRWTAALVFGLTVQLSAMAVAQDDQRARTHFAAGASYYDAGDYEDSLREFERAYELSPRPQLFYNMSLCYQSMGNFQQAAVYLERFLNEVADIPNRGDLERRLMNHKRRASRAAANSPSTTTDTRTTTELQTTVDTRTTTDAQPSSDAGAITVSDTASTHQDTQEAPDPEEPSSGPGLSTPALISFIAAGTGVVMTTAFGIVALGEQSSVEDGCYATRTCTNDDISSMETFALLSDVGLVMAVVGAGLGVYFLLSADREEEAPTATMVPWIDSAGGGAALTGSF